MIQREFNNQQLAYPTFSHDSQPSYLLMDEFQVHLWRQASMQLRIVALLWTSFVVATHQNFF